MQNAVPLGFLVHFLDLPDPRTNTHLIQYQLFEIVSMAFLATLSGAENWAEIQEWAEMNQEWLETFLDLENGIPSHDTFSRVFSLLDPKPLQEALLEWTRDLAAAIPGVIALDGKTLRRTKDTQYNKRPTHLLHAFACETRLCLAQLRVDEKSNEIPAFPELISLLDLRKKTVTIDAMGCQKEVASAVRKKEGDYVLALKENQPTALEEAQELFSQSLKSVPVVTRRTSEKDHGRVEYRKIYGAVVSDELASLRAFEGCQSVWRVTRKTYIRDEIREQESYYISSHPARTAEDAQRVMDAIRAHWMIENSLHWVLDVAMNEDQSRGRKGHEAENHSLLRKMAVNLIRLDSTRKVGVKACLKKAGWSREYLLYLLGLA